jgi:hypothetical protein
MADVSTHSTLPTGLVSYWELEETSGDRIDSHGSNDITLTGTIGSTTGKIGTAMANPGGNNDYVHILDANQSGLDITGDLSFNCWLNVATAPSNEFYWIFSKWVTAGGQRQYRIGYQDSGGTKSFRLCTSTNGASGGSTEQDSSSVDLGTSTWKMVTFVYTASAGTIDIYIDGTLDHQSTGNRTSLNNGTGPFALGSSFALGGQAFNGGMDEAGIWSKALTTTEITALYNSGSGLPYVASGAQTITGADHTASDTFGVGTVSTAYTITGADHAQAAAFSAGAISTTATIVGADHTSADTFGAGTITQGYTVSGAAHTPAASFGAGSVATGYTITGADHTAADTFGGGTITQGLTIAGAAHTNPDTFGSGAISTTVTITGTDHTAADTFGSGDVTQGTTITGTAHTSGDTFGTGSLATVYAITGAGHTAADTFESGAITSLFNIAGAVFAGVSAFGMGAISAGGQSSRRWAYPVDSANGGVVAQPSSSGAVSTPFNSGTVSRG